MYFVMNRSRWDDDHASFSPLVHGRLFPNRDFFNDWINDEFGDPQHATSFETELVAWSVPDDIGIKDFKWVIDLLPHDLVEIDHFYGYPRVTITGFEAYEPE